MRLKTIFIAVALLWGATVHAQGLGDLLKGLGGSGSTIGNLVEGVFTKTNLTLADLVGDYTSEGPAAEPARPRLKRNSSLITNNTGLRG